MSMKISIKTSTGLGRTYSFDVEPSMIVRELKKTVGEAAHYHDLEVLWLVFDGEILYEEATLEDYDIQGGSMLELVERGSSSRSFGGLIGLKFVDVSDDQALQRIGWSRTAPSWRRARHGLCLEGLCKNNQCAAFNRTVIMPVGYKKFDMLDDSVETRTICPACKKHVTPVTCGFNNCWWRYNGSQNVENSPSRPCSSAWREADDAYYRFDEQHGEHVSWKKLVFEAVKTKPAEIPANASTTTPTSPSTAAGQFKYALLAY